MPQSIVPAAFAKIGVGYDQLIESILERAFKKTRFFVQKQDTQQPKLSDQVTM